MTRGSNDQAKGAARDEARPRFAIVIPMLDEGETAMALLEACRAAALPLGSFEICVTNDGSRDGTGAALEGFATAHPDLPVTIITHARPAGQSAAVHDAVRAARAPLICTLDGDGQNPPEEIPVLLAPLLDEKRPAASGARGRAAGQAQRSAAQSASLPAQRTRSAAGSCGTARATPAAVSRRSGARPISPCPISITCTAICRRCSSATAGDVAHVDVTHRPRSAGRSKYNNLGRAIVGLSDLFGVAWLIRRRRILAPDETTILSSGISAHGGAERPS